jgi:hypothetical protein
LLAFGPVPEDRIIRRVLITGLGFCLLLAPSALPQGFGNVSKKKIVLKRKLPPVIQFAGTTFSVKVTARDARWADLAGKMKDLLDTELLKNNDKLRSESNSQELVINCVITNFSIPEPTAFTRNEVVMQKGKQLEQPVQYKKITGSLEVSYQARDPKSGRALDADNVSSNYSEDFEAGTNQQAGKSIGTKVADPFKRLAGKKTEDSSGPPTAPELRENLIHKAIHEIASRITPTTELVEVLLAQGKLDKDNKEAEKGLWSRYLENLERTSPLPNAKDDAYRLYNIGVAYEALAYQTEDRKAAKGFLQDAAINYGKAVDAKPDEKYFLEPQKRIETAMAYYRKLESAPKALAAANAPPAAEQPPSDGAKPSRSSTKKIGGKGVGGNGANSGSAATGGNSSAGGANGKPPATPPKPGAPALTNDQIIKMVKGGVDEDSVIATIHDAPVVQFDLTPDGQIRLTGGGVKAKILAAMRQRAKLPNKKSGGGL